MRAPVAATRQPGPGPMPRTLIDGRLSEQLPASDRGLQYGDGHFTTLACQGDTLLCWDQHLRRLAAAGERLGIPAPDPVRLAAEARLVSAGLDPGVVRITVTRGDGGGGYAPPAEPCARRVVAARPWPADLPRRRREGVRLRTCRTPLGINPALAGLKHLGRLEQVLARRELVGTGADEGLMLDIEGRVVEAISGNLFLVSGDALITPDTARCGVAGVMRERIREHAGTIGWAYTERDVSLAELGDATELFVCNSVFGIQPVREWDGRPMPLGPVAPRLQALLEEAGDVVAATEPGA